MRFLHMADAHLGYRQYHSDERARDFARAFHQICERAIAEQCNLLLVAGDLFHGSAMDPRTFLQAVGALSPVEEAGIEVVAIAGNHDRARKSHALNWLHALQELGLLRLLEVGIEDGELSLEKAIWETDEIRVVGIPYVGMALPQLLPQVGDYLTTWPRKFTVLMLHAGLEGEVPGFRAALTMADLEPLDSLVDYVALGHIHKPYRTPNRWLCNPGSLETVSIEEAQWPDRGALMVCVEAGEAVDFEWAIPERRPFICLELEVDHYDTPAQLMDELYNDLVGYGWDKESLNPLPPVVTLTLEGVLAFDRSALDIASIEQAIRWAFEPLLIRVRDHTETDAQEITVSEGATRANMERQVVRELVARDAGRKAHAEYWAWAILDIRDLALARSSSDKIIAATQSFRRALEEGLC